METKDVATKDVATKNVATINGMTEVMFNKYPQFAEYAPADGNVASRANFMAFAKFQCRFFGLQVAIKL